MEMHILIFTLKAKASVQDGNESLKSQASRSFYPNHHSRIPKSQTIVALAFTHERCTITLTQKISNLGIQCETTELVKLILWHGSQNGRLKNVTLRAQACKNWMEE